MIGPNELSKGEEIQLLESVGCAIDILTSMTYPLDVNDAPIFNEGEAVHITDCEDEWWDSLSTDDRMIAERAARIG